MNNKEAVLRYHSEIQPGKIGTEIIKSIENSEDLSLAYSPGVAFPCMEIFKDKSNIYKYTSKSHTVGIISNGTAALGLGNIGVAAALPIMEGKAVLFKKMGKLNATPVMIDTEDCDEFIKIVKLISTSYGIINLEDIKAPECFIIENRLSKELDIPVFHDDQDGTAIVVLAGLINAMLITNRQFNNTTIVINGAGAAGISCARLIKFYNKDINIILCDSVGVIYKGRVENMSPWKEQHAVDTNLRSLTEVIKGADVFIGLSKANVLSISMLQSMNKNPIVFALSNPIPEINPTLAKSIRKDIIIATGRSDYGNQINNVLCFPYILHGILKSRIKKISNEIKIVTANAIAKLAQAHIPQNLSIIGNLDKKLQFGKEYIIPHALDPRLFDKIINAITDLNK